MLCCSTLLAARRIAYRFLGFQEVVYAGGGEGRIGAEIAFELLVPVSDDDRLKHQTPILGAVNVARAQKAPFEIAELVEAEQRVVTRAAEMTIVGRAFLFAVGRAL